MKDRLFAIIVYIGGFLALMWAVFITEASLETSFHQWGILPRTWIGLRGIPCTVFLHGNLEHLVANSIPFAILGSIVAMHGSAVFWRVSSEIIVMGGILVWIFGGENFHIGASGLVFGYLGYVLFYGWYAKRFVPLIVSLIIFLVYGGALLGVLPSDPHIAWYSHLFGLFAGIGAASSEAEIARRKRKGDYE